MYGLSGTHLYLANHVSKEGMQPSKEKLKTVAEFAPPKTNMEIQAFLGLVRHCRQFIKGFSCIAQPLHRHLVEECACKKSVQVTLMAEAKDTFETLKKACLEDPVLGLLTLTSHFS